MHISIHNSIIKTRLLYIKNIEVEFKNQLSLTFLVRFNTFLYSPLKRKGLECAEIHTNKHN